MSLGLGPIRLRGNRPVTWRTLVGIVLVPLTVAGVFLWGLWNPEERLDTVSAAVVNLDEPVDVDGQLVPLGRVLAGELIGSERDSGDSDGVAESTDRVNFNWQLTDKADAEAGLDDGRYATVITIPENFSAAATSLSSGPDEAEQANIDIATSDRGRLLDNALSSIVTETATTVINQQLGEQFVGNIFVGMTALGEGFSEAADGAGQLADGGSQLADGADEFAAGTGELADGTSQLANGASELANGTGELASGTGELAAGAGELATGAGGLASGASELAQGANAYADGVGEFAAGVHDLADGSAGLASGIEQYTGGVNEALGLLQQGAGGAIEPLQQFRGAVEAGLIPVEDVETTLAQLDGLIAGLQGAVNDPNGDLALLKQSGTDLAQGARASANGAKQLAGGADGLAGGAREIATGASGLAEGAQQLSGGVGEFSSGVSQLAAGANELAAGTGEFAAGAGELSAGMPTLVDGAEQLADGTRQTAEGADELATGLKSGADEVPNYSETERERMAKVAVAPVSSEGTTDELFTASGVPLFAGIALWAGSLALFLVLAPLWRRTREAALGTVGITLRSALPAIGMGAVQGALAGLLLPALLGYSLPQFFGFFAFALIAGISFALVVQGLSALLKGFGRFLAFALLVIAFVVGVVSTVPGPLTAVGDASPIGAAFAGFQAIATSTSGAGNAMFLLVVWGLAGLMLTGLGVMRARRPGSTS